tara:strand:+ start:14606 stop:14923 length:318 start_codon:yes stop_codon:yes gene_type:complete
MKMLFLLTALACNNSKKEEQESVETMKSRTSGSIEIKAFVPEKTVELENKDIFPKPDLDIDGNPVTNTLDKVVVTTLDGKFLTVIEKKTDPVTGIETITVSVSDE